MRKPRFRKLKQIVQVESARFKPGLAWLHVTWPSHTVSILEGQLRRTHDPSTGCFGASHWPRAVSAWTTTNWVLWYNIFSQSQHCNCIILSQTFESTLLGMAERLRPHELPGVQTWPWRLPKNPLSKTPLECFSPICSLDSGCSNLWSYWMRPIKLNHFIGIKNVASFVLTASGHNGNRNDVASDNTMH